MGSILDKLNHLKETKEKIKQALILKKVEVSDDDTFASYAEKINALKMNPFSYITNALNGTPETVTDLIGEYVLSHEDLVCPEIEIPEQVYTDDNPYTKIPIGCFSVGADRSVSATGYVSYQKIKTHPNNRIRIGIKLAKITDTLVLPECAYLSTNSWYISSGTNANASLTRGLIFGQSVAYSDTSWFSHTRSVGDLVMKFPKDFKLTAGATLYLQRLVTNHDVLLEMIENLYDYIGNGEEEIGTMSRTISLGSTMLALLSTDEITLANNKGWEIT